MKTLLLIVLTFAVGCSQGGGNGNGSSPKTNDKINQQSANSLSGQRAVFEAGISFRQQKPLTERYELQQNLDSKKSDQAQNDPKIQKVKSALNNASCKLSFGDLSTSSAPSSSTAAQLPRIKLRTSGGACAIELSLDMDFGKFTGEMCNNGGCKFKFLVVMNYRILNTQLAADLGVLSGSMNMTFDIDQKFPSGANMIAQNMALKMASSIDMKTVSTAGQIILVKGSQNMDMAMITPAVSNGNGVGIPSITGFAKEEFSYLEESLGREIKFFSSMTANGQQDPTLIYQIDNANVTEEVYLNEKKKFDNSMIENNKAGGSSSENPNPSSPSVPTPGPSPTPIQPQPQQPTPSPTPDQT
jgi:hypothetical protein